MSKLPTHLRANIKVPVDTPLTQLNMYVGDNKSGKTSVVGDAIQLAATGKHKIGPHPKNLAELAPPGETELYAELTNGAAAGALSFRMQLTPKPKRPSHTAPPDMSALPVALASEILSFDHAKAREALFSRFGKTTSVDLPTGLKQAQEDAWTDMLGEVATENPTADAAQLLSLMAKAFRSAKLRYGKEVKAAVREIDALSGVAGEAAGVEMLKEMEAERDKAKAYEDSQQTRTAIEEALVLQQVAQANLVASTQQQVDIEAQLAELQMKLTIRTKEGQDVEAQKDALMRAAASARESIAELIEGRDRAEAIVGVIERIGKAFGEGTDALPCPCCNQNMHARHPRTATGLRMAYASARETVDLRREQVSGVLQGAAEFEEQAASLLAPPVRAQEDELLNLRAALATATMQVSTHTTGVATVTARIEASREAVGTAAAYPADGQSSTDIQTAIDALRSAESNRIQITNKKASLGVSKVTRGMMKRLEQESTEMLKTLVGGVTTDAEAAVNQYMPDGMRAFVTLDDGACAWTVEGADGRAHRLAGLAGSEQGALVVAVGLAWTEGAAIRIISLDDESLPKMSPANLRRVLGALEKAAQADPSIQVHAAWPAIRFDHQEEIPTGWNIVYVGVPAQTPVAVASPAFISDVDAASLL